MTKDVLQSLIKLNESTLVVVDFNINRLKPLFQKDFVKNQIPIELKRIEHEQTTLEDYSESIQQIIVLSLTKNNILNQLETLKKQL